MLLNYKITGQGKPVILLHGLFGAKENLGMIARPLSSDYLTIAVDLRNHGGSFHNPEMNYQVMAADVIALMDHLDIQQAALIGHSMGGKVAMKLALDFPDRISELVVMDIAHHAYPPHHQQIMKGLKVLDKTELSGRNQADEILINFEPDLPTRQFLLTNLVRVGQHFKLRLNVEALANNQIAISSPVSGKPYSGRVLLLRGGNSIYVKDASLAEFKMLFPHSRLVTIANAGHMPHVEKTAEVVTAISEFLQGGNA